MTTFYAQPYDICATGFYFDTIEDYLAKIGAIRNAYGQPVEEFELQFIEGDALDAEFAEAFGISQANIAQFLTLIDEWTDDHKIRHIIAVGDCGYSRDIDPVDIDLDLYEFDTLCDLAEHLVDEGLFGEIPSHLVNYIDYDLIARDLSMEYSTTEIAGTRYVYRCG